MGGAWGLDVDRLVAERFPWVCALLLHVMLFVMLADQLTGMPMPPQVLPEAVEVEIFLPQVSAPDDPKRAEVQSQDIAPATAANPAWAAASRGDVSEEKEIPDASINSGVRDDEAATGSWKTATRMLGGSVLADPRSAAARERLATLADGDRIEQICALEAMEQVREREAGFQPTRVVP
ncbi:hypothetical protein FMN50_04555 [Rhodobacterales bacterium]|nr:hypothetical protein FMN50_04555 [Rhodobacterales bacterium]